MSTMTDTHGLSAPDDVTPDPQRVESEIAEHAGKMRAFVAAHGGSGTAVVQYIGRVGARLVVVGGDGLFTDAVVSTVDIAAAVCERAGIEVQDWDRELTARITLSAADRKAMAGTGR
jgi:hypothetical protein